jgi:hypothetical protein
MGKEIVSPLPFRFTFYLFLFRVPPQALAISPPFCPVFMIDEVDRGQNNNDQHEKKMMMMMVFIVFSRNWKYSDSATNSS